MTIKKISSNTIDEFRLRHPYLEHDIAEVRRLIKNTVSPDPALLGGDLASLLESPGKMLRSTLLILGARLGEFDAEKTYRAASALELLHLASLIHDDIVDSSPMRRGVATLHTAHGVKKAVLAGDYVLTRCFGLVADFASPESARLLSAGVGRLCESELILVPAKGSGLRSYKRKAAGKTASLFLMAAYAGARVGESSDSVCGAMRSYGYALGMGFQILDDILDYGGSPEALGKPVGKDSGDGIATLPLILAVRRNPEKFEGILDKPLSKRRSAKIRRRVVEVGGAAAALTYVEDYTRRAIMCTEALPNGAAKDALADLAATLGNRDR